MKRQVEIFMADRTVCEPLIQLVKDTANENDEITIHNFAELKREAIVTIVKEYGIKRIPAVFVDRKYVEGKDFKMTSSILKKAGIGQ